MNIRRAMPHDIPQLIELRKSQWSDEGILSVGNIDKELYEYFQSTLEDGSYLSWIAEDDASIIATSGLCFYTLPPTYSNPSGQIAYVTHMYTKREYRTRGIATNLLNLVIDEAKKQGYRIIRLHASSQGKSLYKRFGFIDSEGYMVLKL